MRSSVLCQATAYLCVGQKGEAEMIRDGLVHVIRTLRSGDTADEWMSPDWAMCETLSPLNGAEVVSLRIEWGDVSAANRDTSGGALAAEYSGLRWDHEQT